MSTHTQPIFNQYGNPMTDKPDTTTMPDTKAKDEPKVAKPATKTTQKKTIRTTKPKPEPEMNHINEVISTVMRETGAQVGKDGTNKHFKFKYVSIDKILTHMRDTMAKHNLVFYMSEVQFDLLERDGAPPLAIAKYACWFEWKDQKTPVEELTQTAVLQKEQTIGALRSYVQKYWLRTKFMLALGEEDLDAEGNSIGETRTQKTQNSPAVQQENQLFHRRNAIVSAFAKLGFGENIQEVTSWILGSFEATKYDLATLDSRQLSIVERFVTLCRKADETTKASFPKTVRHSIDHTITTKDWLQNHNLL